MGLYENSGIKTEVIMNKISGEVVKKYLSEFPNTSSLALARKIYNENKPVFPNMEAVRTLIRYYRGAHGKINKKNAIAKTPIWNIPEGDEMEYTPFIIPDKLKCGAILSDIHFPYHDKRALDTALNYIHKSKCDFMVLNGDILDFHQLSVFLKDPRRKNIAEEIHQLSEFLADIKKNMGKIQIFYKIGNHEERYDKYILQHAAELFHLDAIHLKNILKLKENGIECIEMKRVVKYKHLSILHGHEYRFAMASPVNPARGVFLRTHESTLIGHFHQTSEHSETRLNGEMITCWSTGCLCHLHPEYMPLNKWTNGFAMISGDDDGFYQVRNKRIIDGKII
jgi:predicted phosphodiesterase